MTISILRVLRRYRAYYRMLDCGEDAAGQREEFTRVIGRRRSDGRKRAIGWFHLPVERIIVLRRPAWRAASADSRVFP